MEQVAKLKRTRKLVPVIPIVQKILKTFFLLSFYQLAKFGDLMICSSKDAFKKYFVSCTNTNHDVTDLVNHEMVKNMKTKMSWERNITFLPIKKIPNLCLRWHIPRSNCFVVEVTFKTTVGIWYSALCFQTNHFHFLPIPSPSQKMLTLLTISPYPYLFSCLSMFMFVTAHFLLPQFVATQFV